MQFVIQRHKATIDLGTNARMANFGVHCICEIDRRRVQRQGNHFALRSKDKKFVLYKVFFQTFHEVRRVGNIGLPVDNAVQPVNIPRGSTVFICIVGSNTPLGAIMHFTCADLYF